MKPLGLPWIFLAYRIYILMSHQEKKGGGGGGGSSKERYEQVWRIWIFGV